jgi:hypothetical protein
MQWFSNYYHFPPHIGKYLAVKTSPNDLAHEEAHLSWNASVHAATGLNQLSRKYISGLWGGSKIKTSKAGLKKYSSAFFRAVTWGKLLREKGGRKREEKRGN